MADRYVRNDGSNTSPYETWVKAATALSTALAASAAGEINFVGDGHAETTASAITLTGITGTYTNPVRILCVNDTGNPEPPTALATGAVVETTGTGTDITIGGAVTFGLVIHGVEFKTAAASGSQILIGQVGGNFGKLWTSACKFNGRGTSSSVTATATVVGAGSAFRPFEWRSDGDTLVMPGNASLQAGLLIRQGMVELANPTIEFANAGAKPAAFLLVADASTTYAQVHIHDADLSGYDKSGGAYFDVSGAGPFSILVEHCKLHATPALKTGSFTGPGQSLTLRNVDSGDTIYTFAHYNWVGSVEEERTIVDNDPAEFNAVATGFVIVTTANCNEANPFVVPLAELWNTLTTALDFEIEFVHDSATPMHDRNIYVKVGHAGSTTSPVGAVSSSRNAAPFLDATPANHPAGTATWSGTGGFANENKQRIVNSFTPAEVGDLRPALYVCEASKTLYVSLKARIS